jgi:hypothetical protein
MAEDEQTTRVAAALLEGWLAQRLPEPGLHWLRAQLLAIRAQDDEQQLGKALGKALGWAPRKLGKAALAPDAADLRAAWTCRAGFDPGSWQVDQCARVAFVLACYRGDASAFARVIDGFAVSAEIYELVALYRGFALYPAAVALEPRAREAVRSSMRPIFDAIAHCNPYPAAHFDSAAWNQMVLKTFFLETPLWPVHGLERRANPALARVLVDLAHERWAAGRAVSPELWRCVAPHADAAGLAALARVLERGTEAERLAVTLSLPPGASEAGAALAPLRRECQRQDLYRRASAVDWAALSPWPV